MDEKYRVVYKAFKDLKDNDYIYKEGDNYPREGLKPSKKRIEELSSIKNKIGERLIKKIEEEEIAGDSDNKETEESFEE